MELLNVVFGVGGGYLGHGDEDYETFNLLQSALYIFYRLLWDIVLFLINDWLIPEIM